jgi:hypothetical protein
MVYEEKVEMLLICGECGKKSAAAVRGEIS